MVPGHIRPGPYGASHGDLVTPTFAPLARNARSSDFRQKNTYVLTTFASKQPLGSRVPPGCLLGASGCPPGSMSRVAVRDDKLILWGMKAIPLNLYLNIHTCNKSITFRGTIVGILVRQNRRKNDFPEMCLPGVEIIPRPRRSILHHI